MSIVKTTEEYSTRRKIRYGGGASGSGSGLGGTASALGSSLIRPPLSYSLSAANSNANLTPHKHFYGEDSENRPAYFVEFNIGSFQFDEITIRTEGKRLIVQGKSQADETNGQDESREFKRNFTLPDNVDPYSIKAQLDESTRLLSLIGLVVVAEESTSKIDEHHHQQQQQQQHQQATTTATNASSSESVQRHQQQQQLSSDSNSVSNGLRGQVQPRVGEIRETREQNSIEYEIFLGTDFTTDGTVSVELSGYSNLLVRVVNKQWDTFGDFDTTLTRQIKLPSGADPHQISHGVDARRSCLLVKLPIKSIF